MVFFFFDLILMFTIASFSLSYKIEELVCEDIIYRDRQIWNLDFCGTFAYN